MDRTMKAMDMLLGIAKCSQLLYGDSVDRWFVQAKWGGTGAVWADALNFGDLLTSVLMESYGIKAKYTHSNKANNHALVVSGSILGWLPNTFNRFIIGTGLMNVGEAKEIPNVKILAVRGELTRRACHLPETVILGDPGLLAYRLLGTHLSVKRWRLV